MKSPLDVVCSICKAAITVKCTKKVIDGCNFVDYFHPERIALAAAQDDRTSY